MWNPLNSPLAFEDFNTDDLSGSSALQGTSDGFLRLLPQFTGSRSIYSSWPQGPNWDLSVRFAYSGQASDEGFSSYTGANDLNNFIYEDSAWAIRSVAGDDSYLRLDNTTSHSITGVSGSFIIEMVAAASGATSIDNSPTGVGALGLYIRSYDRHEYVEFHQSGVHFHYHPELDFPIDLTTRKSFRFGVSGNDFYILSEPSYGIAGYGKWDQYADTTGEPLFIMGNPSGSEISGDLNTFNAALWISSFNYFTGYNPPDFRYQRGVTFATNSPSVYTDEYHPNREVNNWTTLRVFHDSSIYGTTTVLPQTRHGNTSWTDQSALEQTLTSDGTTTHDSIDLSNITIFHDGEDRIRFKITQDSLDGSGPAPAIDRLILTSSFRGSRLNLKPDWGEASGNNIIYIGIDTDLFAHFPTPVSRTGDSFLLSAQSYTGGSQIINDMSNTGVAVAGVSGDGTGMYYFGLVSGAGYSGFPNPRFDEPYLPAGTYTLGTSGFELTGLIVGVQGHIASGEYYPVSGDQYTSLYLYKDTHYSDLGALSYSQGIVTQATGVGMGVYVSGLNQGQVYRFSADVKIDGTGSAKYSYDGNEWDIYPNDYVNYGKYSFLFTSAQPADETGQIEILSKGGEKTRFSVDNYTIEEYTGGYGQFSVPEFPYQFANLGDLTGEEIVNRSNLYIDTKIKVMSAPDGYGYIVTSLSQVDASTSGYALRFDRDLIPSLVMPIHYGTSTGVFEGIEVHVSGERALPLNRYIHLAGGLHSVIDDGSVVAARAYVSLNGAVIGTHELNVNNELFSGEYVPIAVNNTYDNAFSIGSGAHVEVDWLRVSAVKEADPEYMAQSRGGFGEPYFQSDKWHQPSGNKPIVLRSFNVDGALVADNLARSTFICPRPEGWRVQYTGAYGTSNLFDATYRGTAYCVFDNLTAQEFSDASGEFTFGTWLTWYGASGTLMSVSDGASRFHFDITNAGNALLYSESGSSLVTGHSSVFTTGTQYHVGLVWGTGEYRGFVNGSLSFSGYHSGPSALQWIDAVSNTHNWYLASSEDKRSYLSCALGETFITPGTGHYWDGSVFQSIANTTGVKDYITTDNVYVDGVAISTGNIIHYDYIRKFVVMPSGEGNATLWTTSNGYDTTYTGDRGWQLFGNRPYKYIPTYNFTVDEDRLSAVMGKTKSPFRIGQSVHEDAVNLALISQPDFSTDNSVSMIDLSHKELNNIANYRFGDFTIGSPFTGNSAGSETGKDWSYSGLLDTKDVVVSSAVVQRKDGLSPNPLFYAYLIGRGDFAVQSPNEDLDSLRKSIALSDNQGNPPKPSEFPWDIHATKTAIDGTTLPSGQYSAVLLTRYPFLPGTTLWATYNGAPYYSGNSVVYGQREIIYPEPIYEQGTDYDLVLRSGQWDLTLYNILETFYYSP